MDSINKKIEERIVYLDKIIKEKERALIKCPEGTLRVNKTGNSVQYYQCFNDNRNGKYLRKNQMKLIRSLAQKDYDQKVLRNAIIERNKLVSAAGHLGNKSVESVFTSLSSERQQLVDPVWLPDDLFIKQWESYRYTPKPFSENCPEFYTEKGERVRSKSEVIIADTLNKMMIPYRYECPLVFKNGVMIHPDFTVLNVVTRKTMYLEHLGSMDYPFYSGTSLERISLFESNGIYLGDRLVITYETSRKPLNIKSLKDKFKRDFM